MAKQDLGQEKDARLPAIGNKLKTMRLAQGYTSAETFAYENSLNRVSYWRIENGQNFTLKMLLKILDIHHTSLEEFFRGL